MAGLDPAIHVPDRTKSWMPGSSPGMTILFLFGRERVLAALVDAEANDLVPLGIAHHAGRVLAGLDRLDLLAQQLPPHGDAGIGAPEQLRAAVVERALRLPGHKILREEGAEIVLAVRLHRMLGIADRN